MAEQLPSPIRELREEVDEIDEKLIDLIAQRQDTVMKIAANKTEKNIPIYDPEREKQIFDKVEKRFGKQRANGFKLVYGIMMDIHRYREYEVFPKDFYVPTGCGGMTIRAIIEDTPFSLCRYLSPLSVANVTVLSIQSQSCPGGKLIVEA